MKFRSTDILLLEKIPVSIYLGVALVSGVLLFISDGFMPKLNVNQFLSSYGVVVLILFFLSIYFIVRSIIKKVSHFLSAYFKLFRLDSGEQSVLREFPIQNKEVIYMPKNDPAVINLINSGILKVISFSEEERFYLIKATMVCNVFCNKIKLGLPKDQTVRDKWIIKNRPKWATTLDGYPK